MDLTRADRSAMSEPESLRAVAGGDGGGEGGDADEDLAAEDARDLPDLPGLPEISRAARSFMWPALLPLAVFWSPALVFSLALVFSGIQHRRDAPIIRLLIR